MKTSFAEIFDTVDRDMGNKGGKIVLTEEIVDQISRTSGIGKDQVRSHCQNFLRDYPSGNMDRNSYAFFLT